jgi:light-regulated signal transduction histidine kinase (bacteriophytochrome)
MSTIQRYGLAVLSVAAAVLPALVLQHYKFHDVGLPLLLLAVAVTAWYAGTGPSVLAIALSFLCFDYFFAPPFYDFSMTVDDVPAVVVLILIGVLVARFAAIRLHIERDLRHARDKLQEEVVERTAQAKAIRALNEELEKRSLALEASNKELEAFAYSVSHDLRAPLRHMAGFAELLQKSAAAKLDEKAQRYLRIILDSAQRMGKLIDDLLAFSRIGRAEAQRVPVQLDQLLKEALTEVRPETNGRDIEWNIGKLPVCYGDPSMLRLVLINLLSNAVKFTRARARAQIAVGCAEESADEAVVFVKDNGAGFDMKYVDKLFGVFQRLHHVDAFEGTGIGLATVQRIIHRHGGKIRGEGALDQGATFYFSVPKFAVGLKDGNKDGMTA